MLTLIILVNTLIPKTLLRSPTHNKVSNTIQSLIGIFLNRHRLILEEFSFLSTFSLNGFTTPFNILTLALSLSKSKQTIFFSISTTLVLCILSNHPLIVFAVFISLSDLFVLILLIDVGVLKVFISLCTSESFSTTNQITVFILDHLIRIVFNFRAVLRFLPKTCEVSFLAIRLILIALILTEAKKLRALLDPVDRIEKVKEGMDGIRESLLHMISDAMSCIFDSRLHGILHGVKHLTDLGLYYAHEVFGVTKLLTDPTNRTMIKNSILDISNKLHTSTPDMSNCADNLIVDESHCLAYYIKRQSNCFTDSLGSEADRCSEDLHRSFNSKTDRRCDNTYSSTNDILSSLHKRTGNCIKKIDRSCNDCFSSSPDCRACCCSSFCDRSKNTSCSINHTTKEVFLDVLTDTLRCIPYRC